MSLGAVIAADWKANPRDPKARAILLLFRISQSVWRSEQIPIVLRLCFVAVYRLWTEWLLGLELRPKTEIGPGLRIHHAFGLVVNDHAVIGRNVTLRHGVTIGHSRLGGRCPVVGDDVDFGAGAIVLGDIRVGNGAQIGAGAVVTRDVPEGCVAVGNPAVIRGRTDARKVSSSVSAGHIGPRRSG